MVNNQYYKTTNSTIKEYTKNNFTKIENKNTISPIPGTIPLDQGSGISIQALIELGQVTYTDDDGNVCK